MAFASLAHTLGAPIIVLRKFDATAWIRLVREHRVTNTFSAPTQLKRIVNLPADVLAGADMSSMICLIANAAPVPYALKEEVFEKLGTTFLFEVYGSTELGIDTVLKPEDQLRKPGSCGKTYGGITLRIVRDDGTEAAPGEPGELFVTTTLAMDGYHHTAEKLTQIEDSDWKSVGDVAYVDDEGYVYICDRKKDMIISGGVNIYPAEIEAVLHGHPQVLDVAVFGIPDDEWGERVHAIVQAKPGETIDLDELRAFAEQHLGGYKRPRAYELRDSLPRTDSGKLLKRMLRDEYWQGTRRRLSAPRGTEFRHKTPPHLRAFLRPQAVPPRRRWTDEVPWEAAGLERTGARKLVVNQDEARPSSAVVEATAEGRSWPPSPAPDGLRRLPVPSRCGSESASSPRARSRRTSSPGVARAGRNRPAPRRGAGRDGGAR